MDGRDYGRYIAIVNEAFSTEATLETKFSDLGIDSLDAMELVMDIEERLNVHITDTEFDKCPTVGDLWEVVKGKINASTMGG